MASPSPSPSSSASESQFKESFERWRIAITSLTLPRRSTPQLRCEEQPRSPASFQPAPTEEMTDAERKQQAKECKRCEKMRDDLVRESASSSLSGVVLVAVVVLPIHQRSPPGPIVRFLLQNLALLPPAPGADPASTSSTPNLPLPINCAPCPPTMAGGYSPVLGILLCQNRYMSKKHMEDALSHELIHAYDGRKFEVDEESWGMNLRAHACTEIRAENLSGDCRWGREVTRRNFNFAKQHQACVRRRAILSVASNPYCKSEEEAEKTVNEVWESCFPDTRPFDEIY